MFNAHVGKSMYAMQLRRWFNVFGRKNFKVRAKRIFLRSKVALGVSGDIEAKGRVVVREVSRAFNALERYANFKRQAKRSRMKLCDAHSLAPRMYSRV